MDGKPLLSRMIRSLHHRGPDESGTYFGEGVGLGHARLSIIDVAGGRQPLTNEDGTLWITFNGEIFNYLELREELVRKGHVFSTRTDTEVILHLFEQEGEDCVQRLNGQWAFAIWNTRDQTLFLSRDRFGVRPLFYTSTGDRFLFASEVKAILEEPSVRRQPDYVALDQIMTYWCTLPPRTMFQGISELPPGSSAVLRNGAVTVRKYWRLRYSGNGVNGRTPEQHGEALLDLLTDATRLRMRSDVPVGAYLSGGLDSTVTTALARKLGNGNLRSFSLAFEDAEFDESQYQDEAVRFLETDHCQVRCRTEDIGKVFPEVIRHTEQPVLRTAPAPMFLLSRLVRDSNYKVVLTGEGADEMLGGYDIFKEAKIRRFCSARPDSRWRPHLLRRLYPYMAGIQAQSPAYLQAFFKTAPEETERPFFSHRPRWELTSRLKEFLTSDVKCQIPGGPEYGPVEDLMGSDYESWDYFSQAQSLETNMLLPGYILSSQGDRMAMAHGVEGRFPFLDYRVAEFAAGISPNLRMKVLNEKYLLKLCTRGIIPPAVTRRSKQPYRAPDVRSFLGGRLDYVDEALSEGAIRRVGIFEPELVGKLVKKARALGRGFGVRDNMAFVGILSTQLWSNQFMRS